MLDLTAPRVWSMSFTVIHKFYYFNCKHKHIEMPNHLTQRKNQKLAIRSYTDTHEFQAQNHCS
jgi:hypothetical protein